MTSRVLGDTATADEHRLLNAGIDTRHGGRDIGEFVVVAAESGNTQHAVRNGLREDATAIWRASYIAWWRRSWASGPFP